MSRIRVTGTLLTGELDPEHVDFTHPTGLTPKGYEHVVLHMFPELDDVTLEKDNSVPEFEDGQHDG